ncbi:sialate O-acetylesterase [Spirosoma sp. KUDC1026]|uniref:T9SS type A sorting domain-containing protein n=1 Tax=Spirosoma sp. KUDC1026 TaxID=2745947 RepID=UPI00159BD7D9|nr:sialate O-acetylesterase [Spirosoma sp. KUDC1026]QKZ14511.1 T9SS type A sorting domain-containing protein [Spirosoma sp. KUDC1026]
MKRFLIIFFVGISLWPGLIRAQVSVVLEQWPARLQLYPRDQNSQCAVPITGRVTDRSAVGVSLLVTRNQQPYQYAYVRVDSVTGRFSFLPFIKAERSEYGFQLTGHRAAGDSVRIAVRDSIVCGDVFLIMGQSNAIGRFEGYRNEFCRTFGVNNGNRVYNPADTAWCLSNTTEGDNALWGVELQRLILEQQGVPTAIINGAAGSTAIYDHTNRGGSDLSNLYGRLLYRARKAGVSNQVKAMIWRQGEAEAAGNADQYAQLFPQLYGYWKQDYPGIKRVYHSQLNLLRDEVIKAGAVRDYQRRSGSTFPDNVPIATVGLPAYQGLHYGEAAYRQFGTELYRLVARDFYGATDTSNIQSPNVQRIYYGTPEQDEIVIEFEPGQEMRWPADTTVTNPANAHRYSLSLRDLIYTDYPYGETGLVRTVTEEGNRLRLKLSKATTGQNLTYLPSYYRDSELGYFAGPTIKNRRGVRALTFYQVPINPPLPVADLRAMPVDTSAIQLFWSNINSNTAPADEWVLERADSTGAFIQLARLTGSTSTYLDARTEALQIGRVYQYRIRSFGKQAVADYSPVATASMRLVLSTEEEIAQLVRLYPNPAQDLVQLQISAPWQRETLTVTVYNDAGRTLLQTKGRPQNGLLSISVNSLATGLYTVRVQAKSGQAQRRLLISH